MKKIVHIVCLLLSVGAFAQQPQTQQLGNDSTLIRLGPTFNGILKGGIVLQSFQDTTVANATHIDFYNGALIWVNADTSIYTRFKGSSSQYWVKVTSASMGPGGGAWQVGGNYFSVVPVNAWIGTNSTDHFQIATDAIVRLKVPSNGILRSSGSANKYLMMDTVTKLMYYGDGGGSSSTAISALTAATASNTIDNGAFLQEWQWNTLAGTSGLKLSSTSTAATGNAQRLFEASLSGTSVTANQITVSGYFGNSHAGSLSVNRGVQVNVSGGVTLNTGVYSQASGTSGTVYGVFSQAQGSATLAYGGSFSSNGATTNIGVQAIASGGSTNIALDLGQAGFSSGTMRINGSTSGSITIQPAAAAGTWTMTLPTTGGTSGYFLQTNGSGVTTWAAGSGSGAINLYGQAWVDSATGSNVTGTVGNPALPYATINAALTAVAGYHTARVNIGLGSYARIDSSLIRSNLVIMGSGMPMLDNADTATGLTTLKMTMPTKLLHGTIIKGGLQIRNNPSNLEIGNLGFDNGSAFVALGNRKWDGLDIRDPGTGTGNTPPFKQMKGIYFHDMVCLGDTVNSAYHAMTLENCIDPVVKNVLLVGNTHGLAVKTIGGLYDGIVSFWHTSDCAILKINNYAPSHEMILTNFTFRSLSETDKESEGLLFQNETGTAVRTGYVVSNGTIRFTNRGIYDYGSHDMYNLNISNVTIHKTANSAVHLTLMSQGNLANVIADSTGGNGFWIQSTGGGNILSNNQALVNTYNGFDITGGTNKTYLFSNIARGNNNGIVATDGNVLGEDNVAVSNASANFSGTTAALIQPYLIPSWGAKSVGGITTAGVPYPLYVGSGLTISSGGGVDTLKTSGGGGGGSTVVSDSAWTYYQLNTIPSTTAVAKLGTINTRQWGTYWNNINTILFDSTKGGSPVVNPTGADMQFIVNGFGYTNADPFLKVGNFGSSEYGIRVGRDAAFDVTRLRIIGPGSATGAEWIRGGNGGTEVYWGVGAYNSYNNMRDSVNNYNSNPFYYTGFREFRSRRTDAQGASVASANNVTLGTDGNTFEITGTTQINLINRTNYQNGSEITLLFTSNPTVKNGQTTSSNDITILLAGAADFSASANDVLKLILSTVGGVVAWRETGRSVN